MNADPTGSTSLLLCLVRAVGGSNGLVQLLLIGFIFLVTITIANMIIAIIIANIKELQEEAEQDQLTR